jgi:putative oxidoreductase
MKDLIRRATSAGALLDHLQPVVLLAARLYVASVFFRAGLLKIADWSSTLALFHNEYKVPLLPPDVAACVGTFGELAFPVLIVLGLASRLGAAGLFAVNAMAVISYPQLFGFDCPAAIHSHFYWGSLLLGLLAFGPGRWSMDAWIVGRSGMVATRPARMGLQPPSP